MAFNVPNELRIRDGHLGSDDSAENNGAFMISLHHYKIFVIASDGDGWERVSASMINRCPRWDEMCYIKDVFWDRDDCVVQFHPPEKNYVNFHPHCLHLWRPIGIEFPQPPKYLVGAPPE